MKALFGQIDALARARDSRQTAVVSRKRRIALAIGALFGEEALVGVFKILLVGVGVELIVALEFFDVFEVGSLVGRLGLRLLAVLHLFKLFVQAHSRPPSPRAPWKRRGFFARRFA